MATVSPNWMIEQAVPEDAEAIARMHGESFKAAYLLPGEDEHNAKVIEEATAFVSPGRIQARMALINQAMENPDRQYYHIAMSDEGAPIGLIYGTKSPTLQEIEALYVDQNYFGAGVGAALVEGFVEWADSDRPIELGVVKFNERAQRFYTKMGFQALGDDRVSYYPFLPETTMVLPVGGNKQ